MTEEQEAAGSAVDALGREEVLSRLRKVVGGLCEEGVAAGDVASALAYIAMEFALFAAPEPVVAFRVVLEAVDAAAGDHQPADAGVKDQLPASAVTANRSVRKTLH